MLLEVNPKNPEPRKVQRAIDALTQGGIIAYPTDATYGLGCDLLNRKAIDRLYELKGLDRSRRLSFVCADLANVSRYALMHDHVFRVLKRLLPGPYTFVLEATREVPKVIQCKRRTVGVRIPDNPVPIALVKALGHPIITTTAARHGAEPLPDPAEIDEEFAGLALVLDGGPGGMEPTSVVDLSRDPPEVLRAGAGDVSEFG
ncbi:MAG: threonylcarbamoyl-AMP synthase [Polyangiaceae bacterium]|nr:threonylcarbamoyl-AMP synthase [Polyangiaceae bacterium]